MTHLLETEVVVVGGGVTAVAVLRDLALRGVNAVLVECFDGRVRPAGRAGAVPGGALARPAGHHLGRPGPPGPARPRHLPRHIAKATGLAVYHPVRVPDRAYSTA